MDRKEFIKTTCSICLSGMAISFPSLYSCSPYVSSVYKAIPVNNSLEMPLHLFEKTSLQFVRPKDWQYEIAVQKKEDGTYSALLMQCTHMENQVIASQNGFTCSLHGSRFDSYGNVVKGPAEIKLKEYRTIIENNKLIIKL